MGFYWVLKLTANDTEIQNNLNLAFDLQVQFHVQHWNKTFKMSDYLKNKYFSVNILIRSETPELTSDTCDIKGQRKLRTLVCA